MSGKDGTPWSSMVCEGAISRVRDSPRLSFSRRNGVHAPHGDQSAGGDSLLGGGPFPVMKSALLRWPPTSSPFTKTVGDPKRRKSAGVGVGASFEVDQLDSGRFHFLYSPWAKRWLLTFVGPLCRTKISHLLEFAYDLRDGGHRRVECHETLCRLVRETRLLHTLESLHGQPGRCGAAVSGHAGDI